MELLQLEGVGEPHITPAANSVLQLSVFTEQRVMLASYPEQLNSNELILILSELKNPMSAPKELKK